MLPELTVHIFVLLTIQQHFNCQCNQCSWVNQNNAIYKTQCVYSCL